MNLNEMLIYADFQQLNNMVEHYQCQCDPHSKTDMVQAILYKLFRNDTLNSMINNLSEEEFTFFQLLYLDSKTKYTIEDLLAKGKQAISIHQAQKKPRELALLSIKKGWVFQGVGKKNALVYLVPEDFKQSVHKIIYHNVKRELKTTIEIPFYRDEKDLMLSDLVSFLNFVKNDEVLLTGEGNIYKRQQQSILKLLNVEEKPIKKQAWRFGYGRRYNEYPDRFSLIYDYAYYHKLIDEVETGLLQITSSGEQWLKKITLDKENMNLYRFWVRLYKYPIPFLPLIIKYIDLIAFDEWVNLDSLQDSLIFWLKDRYYETKETIFKERIIKMLHHLGILKIGQFEGMTFIKVSQQGHYWINGFESFYAKEIIIDN